MPQGGRGQDMSFRSLGVFRFRAGNFFDAEKVTKKAFGGQPRMPPFLGECSIVLPLKNCPSACVVRCQIHLAPLRLPPLDAVTN